MTALQFLIDLTISKVNELHDYIQLLFSDGTTLSIFNNHRYHGGSLAACEGKRVASVEESDGMVIIVFDGGESLSISLNDDDYNGPEAIVLNRAGHLPVVWS